MIHVQNIQVLCRSHSCSVSAEICDFFFLPEFTIILISKHNILLIKTYEPQHPFGIPSPLLACDWF